MMEGLRLTSDEWLAVSTLTGALLPGVRTDVLSEIEPDVRQAYAEAGARALGVRDLLDFNEEQPEYRGQLLELLEVLDASKNALTVMRVRGGVANWFCWAIGAEQCLAQRHESDWGEITFHSCPTAALAADVAETIGARANAVGPLVESVALAELTDAMDPDRGEPTTPGLRGARVAGGLSVAHRYTMDRSELITREIRWVDGGDFGLWAVRNQANGVTLELVGAAKLANELLT